MKPSEAELASALSGDDPLPPIEVFIGIPKGLRLSQRADGSIEAKAQTPELVGEEFLIHGLTKAGETKAIKVRAQ